MFAVTDFTAPRGSASNQREAIPQSIRVAKDHFGKEPANSFTSDQHPDLRADYVMANPPFNISEWWDAKLEGDPLNLEVFGYEVLISTARTQLDWLLNELKADKTEL